MNHIPAQSREGTASFENDERVDFHRASEHMQPAAEYYHETDEDRARREALGAAATQVPLEQEKRFAEIEMITRCGEWLEHARQHHPDRIQSRKEDSAAA